MTSVESPGRAHQVRGPAFTLTELLVSIAILVVLVGISIPVYNGVRTRMTEGTCVSQMKRIYFALDAHVKEHNSWPQQPLSMTRENEIWEWWYHALEPFSISKKDWLCPIHAHGLRQGEGIPEYMSSYIPTTFDGRRLTPYRWNQPWLMERGDFHKKGAYIVMPDGSIHRSSDFMSGGLPSLGGDQ